MGRFSISEATGLERGEGVVTRLDISAAARVGLPRGAIAGAVLGRLEDELLFEP